MYIQEGLFNQNRERKKSSRVQKSIYQKSVNEEQQKERYVENRKKFFKNSKYDPSQCEEQTILTSTKSYLEAINSIKKGNNSEIKRLRQQNPYLNAAQKMLKALNKITTRTLLAEFFAYNSLKNRKMSDTEQKFRKRNQKQIRESQNIEQKYYYACRFPDKCWCGWPRPTNCPLGPRIRVYL